MKNICQQISQGEWRMGPEVNINVDLMLTTVPSDLDMLPIPAPSQSMWPR